MRTVGQQQALIVVRWDSLLLLLLFIWTLLSQVSPAATALQECFYTAQEMAGLPQRRLHPGVPGSMLQDDSECWVALHRMAQDLVAGNTT